MKQTMRFLSIAVLVTVGAMTMGCNKAEADVEPQQEDSVVTFTTTVAFEGGAETRALTSTGVKTFAAGETMAIIYKNTSGNTLKAVSAALTDSDITTTDDPATNKKSASFTFELENPNKSQNITYIYPAAMANDDGTENYDALATQDGTLAALSSSHDLATYTGAWNGTSLPTGTLTNRLAILAITLKNGDGSSEITNTITGMTISDGTNNYTVTRSAAAGPIYVAIHPTSTANIEVTAYAGPVVYSKSLTGKTYAASNGYSVSWRMTKDHIDLALATSATTALDGDVITGTLGNNVKISIADGATVTLDGVSINASGTWTSGDYAGLTCEGDATIILSGENILRGIDDDYPGIHIAENKTLTIRGTGSLDASGNPTGNCYSAGIGGVFSSKCGNIVIEGGTITATGGNEGGAAIGGAYCGGYGYITISGGTVTATAAEHGAGIGSGYSSGHASGNITISGGTVTATSQGNGAGIGSGYSSSGSVGDILISGGTITATGGNNAAGIGSSHSSSCGGITIESTVTRVTATKGSGAPNSIGAGNSGTCGTVKFGDATVYSSSAWSPDPMVADNYGGLMLSISTTTNTYDTWTLFPCQFSVSSTKQVYFAPGNLQYNHNEETYKWRFAANQYDFTGAWNTSTWVDLFGWGTWTGSNDPLKTSDSSGDYSWSGDDFTKESLLYDATQRNYDWYTLSYDEWKYLIDDESRTYRYRKSVVHSISGLLLFPDDFNPTAVGVTVSSGLNQNNSSFVNVTDEDWAKMEAAGCAFLPAAGMRTPPIAISDVGSAGYYWSSSIGEGSTVSLCLTFDNNNCAKYQTYKKKGYSVRLVRDVN